MQVGEPRTEEDVAAAVDDVLTRREFREEESMLADLFEWLGDRLELGQIPVIGDFLFWLLLGLLAALVTYGLTRFLVAGRSLRERPGTEDVASGPSVLRRVALLRAEAREARGRGDLRLALRKNLFALILGMGNRGDLEYRDAWTNRELLRRGRPSAKTLALLRPLVVDLEAKEFGREPATSSDLDHLESLCESNFGRLEGAAA